MSFRIIDHPSDDLPKNHSYLFNTIHWPLDSQFSSTPFPNRSVWLSIITPCMLRRKGPEGNIAIPKWQLTLIASWLQWWIMWKFTHNTDWFYTEILSPFDILHGSSQLRVHGDLILTRGTPKSKPSLTFLTMCSVAWKRKIFYRRSSTVNSVEWD